MTNITDCKHNWISKETKRKIYLTSPIDNADFDVSIFYCTRCNKAKTKVTRVIDKSQKTNAEQKAKEILDYCVSYLSNFDGLETKKFEKTKRYKEMLKEIKFMLETD